MNLKYWWLKEVQLWGTQRTQGARYRVEMYHSDSLASGEAKNQSNIPKKLDNNSIAVWFASASLHATSEQQEKMVSGPFWKLSVPSAALPVCDFTLSEERKDSRPTHFWIKMDFLCTIRKKKINLQTRASAESMTHFGWDRKCLKSRIFSCDDVTFGVSFDGRRENSDLSKSYLTCSCTSNLIWSVQIECDEQFLSGNGCLFLQRGWK